MLVNLDLYRFGDVCRTDVRIACVGVLYFLKSWGGLLACAGVELCGEILVNMQTGRQAASIVRVYWNGLCHFVTLDHVTK